MSADVTAEKTIFDVLRDVWVAKLYIFAFVVIALIIAFVFTSFAKDFYRAEMILAPAVPLGQGMHGGASIGEGSIQTQNEELQSSSAFLQFENIFDGVSVASYLIKDPKIVSALEADQAFEFSKSRKDWTTDSLAVYLKKRIKLEPVSGTPLRRLRYLHAQKDMAVYMINRVHDVADEIIRARILKQVVERIDYLHAAMARTTNPDHRRSLTDLLMEQERIRMMVSLDQSFAATIIEPAAAAAKPSWPDPYMVYVVFVFAGAFLGFVVYGLRHHG